MSIHRKARGKTRDTQSSIRLDALKYAQKVFEAIDTPLSLGCFLRLKHGEHKQLVEMSIDPLDYRNPEEFFLDYQCVKLLSKYPYLDTGIDTEAVAREAFLKAEASCRKTNNRWRLRDSGFIFDTQFEQVIYRAQRKIADILGKVPSYEALDFAFGPGAAFGVRKETSVYNKVTSTLECTFAFADKLSEFLAEFPGWIPEGIHSVTLLPGSQLTYVPKNAKTDRPICIEPLLNGLYQKGVGSYIRSRLGRWGVNLNDQTINQVLAEHADVRKLSTIDFSSASDTIAYNLVLNLLPIDWFDFLDVARSPSYLIDGRWENFQKFSSMGNAYTFELESLLFYGLAAACCEVLGIQTSSDVLSVYGDDVIIPRDAFDLFSQVTEICGFEINHSKSFKDGPFYESCGKDFFFGVNVRPFFLKVRLNKLLPAFYAANTLLRLIGRIPKGSVQAVWTRNIFTKDVHWPEVVRALTHVHTWVVARIPRSYRTMGPEGYGDGHLIWEYSLSVARRHPSWDGWWFHTWQEQAIRIKLPEWPLAYALYQCRTLDSDSTPVLKPRDASFSSLGYTVRGRTFLRKSRVFCRFQWQGPGDVMSAV